MLLNNAAFFNQKKTIATYFLIRTTAHYGAGNPALCSVPQDNDRGKCKSISLKD
jgi:hypothetical protein